MSTVNAWAGGASQSGFVVKGHVDATPDALHVSLSPEMSDSMTFSVVAVGGIATGKAAGLDVHTWYYYAMSFGGVIDTEWVGRIRTTNRAGVPGGGKLASWSCAGHQVATENWHPQSPSLNDYVPWSVSTNRPLASNHPAFTDVENQGVDYVVQMGDIHYWDIPVNNVAWFHDGIDWQLSAPRQQSLWKSLGIVYMWDDHDFGPDDGDFFNDSRPAALQFYRERVPSHEVPGAPAEPPYHSFVDGRVRYIISDVRADRDPKGTPEGVVFRQAQEDWFISELEKAKREGQVVCWVNCKPWIAAASAGADHWGGYAHYRDHLLGRMTEVGILDQIFIIAGDMHGLAFDDGRHNQWGGFPVFQLASIDSNGSIKGGPYWKGPSQGRNRYGVVEYADDGETITITVTGYIGASVWDSYTHEFPMPPKARGAQGKAMFPMVRGAEGWQGGHVRPLFTAA